MDRHELNRVFDQLAPTPEQEEAVLDRLLEPVRKAVSMRKLNKWVAAGIAAALVLVSCAAAVTAGIVDQRLLDFMHWGEQDQELLAPCALRVDVTAEDNGAALHISQVLMDRYNIMLLADFTAPEGTVLDQTKRGPWSFGGPFRHTLELLDQAGERIDLTHQGTSMQRIGALVDEDPLDNHLTLFMSIQLGGEGIRSDWGVAGLALSAENLQGPDLVYPGDWSCQIPITWQDMGRSIQPNQAVEVKGTDILLMNGYLSPMTLQIQLDQVLKFEYVNQVTLTARDGRSVSALLDGGYGAKDQFLIYRLDEIIDPDQFRSFTLSIGEEKVEFSLDDLAPAE